MPNPAVAMVGSSVVGLMGRDKGGTTTQQTELPDFLKPYGPIYAQQGYNLSQQPFNPYPFEGVAPFSQDQNRAMDMVRQQATGGQNPLFGAAQQQTMNTMGGQYLNPETNPYLKQTFDTAADRVTDAFGRGTAAQTDARFARAGAFGGSAWNEIQGANQQALGDSLSGMAANIYGNNYAQERNNQMQATQFAPQLAGNMSTQGYRDAEALLGTGGMQQQLGQSFINDDMSRFQQAQQYPYQQFQTFGQMFNPNMGSNQSMSQPGVGAMQGLLGGAMGGLGMYNMGQQSGLWGQSGGGGGSLGAATSPMSWGGVPGMGG